MKKIAGKNKALLIGTLFFLVSFLFASQISHAAGTYTLLEPVSGKGTVGTSPSEIESYIKTVYKYALNMTISVAVLMLIVGGVEYTITWASESKKGEAKNRIENAIIGLLIALTGYLVLYTINPNLVTLKMEGAEKCAGGGGSGSGGQNSSTAGGNNSQTSGSGSGSDLGNGNSDQHSIKKLAATRVPNQNTTELTKAYGAPGTSGNQTTIKFQGKDLRVNKNAATAFEKWSKDIDAYNAERVARGEEPYKVKTITGYSNRANVNDPSKTSIHAWGTAIDINQATNANKSSTTDMPDDFIKLAYKDGFRWGGEWPPGGGNTDPMHFEYIGGGGYTNGKNGTQIITGITPKS